jgi:hypothetical protein
VDKELLELLEPPDLKVFKVCRDRKVIPALPEQQVLQASQEMSELLV